MQIYKRFIYANYQHEEYSWKHSTGLIEYRELSKTVQIRCGIRAGLLTGVWYFKERDTNWRVKVTRGRHLLQDCAQKKTILRLKNIALLPLKLLKKIMGRSIKETFCFGSLFFQTGEKKVNPELKCPSINRLRRKKTTKSNDTFI